VDVNINIEDKDIHYLKEYLKDKVNPVDLEELAYRLALFKTKETRSHRVMMYNPDCEYKVGDLIYKEYPGKIPIGSKKYIEMDRGVVLKVVDVRTRFGIEEVQLKYDGTSDFKKYADYLDRQKIELLLPHKQAKPCEKVNYLPENNDPRKQQAPLEKKDFTALKKKLAGAINKEADIAIVSRKILLKQHLKSLDDIVFTKIKEFLQENKKSEHTEFFVENFAKIKPEDEQFDAYCFALNYRMMKDFKIDFQQTQDVGWGKWNLISVIYYMKKDSPISEVNPLINNVIIANKRNLMQRRRKFEDNLFQDSCMRFYLTQREISAGAIKLKPGFFDLGESIEVEVVDGRQKKSYLVYYYKDVNLMLGFKEIYERYKALQGTILTFELTEDGKLQFNIRTTKKGTIVDRVKYVKEEKAFRVSDEKVASPVFVNKAIFLDSPVLKTLYEKLKEFRSIDSLNKLIHKVFLEFGVKERNYEIHILRLYHIMDLIYPVDFKLVEDVILGNDEFVPAEKMAGVFYLDSDAVAEIEEEELKRKEFEADEHKKRREELKRKKIERERRIKEEIRRKREERRKKREQEMWEKERLKKEMEEKRLLELKKKKEEEARRKEEEARRKSAFRAERPPRPKERRKPPGKKFEPGPPKDHRRPEGPYVPHRPPRPPRPKPEYVRPQPPPPPPPSPPGDELLRKREIPPRRDKEKRKIEEERERAEKAAKAARKVERRPEEDALSEDEIKSQIELEKLKEKMRERREAEKAAEKAKKVAYHDNGGFGGVFASQLDKIVKKEDEKPKKEEDKEKKKR
jgi:hypothetical protein